MYAQVIDNQVANIVSRMPSGACKFDAVGWVTSPGGEPRATRADRLLPSAQAPQTMARRVK